LYTKKGSYTLWDWTFVGVSDTNITKGKKGGERELLSADPEEPFVWVVSLKKERKRNEVFLTLI